MAIHGLPRATVDIDILILENDLNEVWRVAKANSYDIEGLPMHFGEVEIRRISKIDEKTKQLYTLDLLLVTPATEDVWQDREVFAWQEGEVSSVSRAGLIKLKEFAGRPQDKIDIERLKEEHA